MCLLLKTFIPIPHFTLWKSKKVKKLLYDKYGTFITPYRHAIVPDNGILIPNNNYINNNYLKDLDNSTWTYSKYCNRFRITNNYIHCYIFNIPCDDDYGDSLYEAEIPPFTLYFKGSDHDIACKKLIVHTDKPIKY